MAVPSTPANLTIDQVASNAIVLSWDNVANEDGFHIWISYDSGVTYEILLEVDADTLIGYAMPLGSETEYYFKVSAFNTDGDSALSTSVNDTTLAVSRKYAWTGNKKKSYDENAIYYRDTITQVGGRSETVVLSEEAANTTNEVLRYGQLGGQLAASDEEFVVISASARLSDERVLTAGDAITLTDGGAGSTATIAVDPAAHVADASESHTITDPGDAPADADALRDDLVANAIPDIEGALNALGVKVNAIISALETAKLMETS